MTLQEALADYLRRRRRLGFEMPQDGRLLEGFVEFLERAGAERITTDLALTWARMPVNTHLHCWHQRLSVVRGFARHLATIDPESEVPSKDLLPGHRPRIAPYIYTEQEIQALMAAAGRLTPRLRAARHRTLIGLLAVTGMRPGEALALDRQDVNLREGVVHVRAGKQKKQREVPLHTSTTRALREYAQVRDARFPAPSTPAFFISARGRRMGSSELNRTFTELIREVGLEGRGARAGPRPHDLRHALAVHTLLDWHAAGENIDQRMPLLSTFLGHYAGDRVKGDPDGGRRSGWRRPSRTVDGCRWIATEECRSRPLRLGATCRATCRAREATGPLALRGARPGVTSMRGTNRRARSGKKADSGVNSISSLATGLRGDPADARNRINDPTRAEVKLTSRPNARC